jgi:hypothetical protein
MGRVRRNVQAAGVPQPVLINNSSLPQLSRSLLLTFVSNDIYDEFPTNAGVMAIFMAEAQEWYIPGSALPASNKSAILEFKVANAGGEFTLLQHSEKTGSSLPQISHGARALLFS